MTRTGRIITAEDKTAIHKEAMEPGCNRSALAEKWGVSRAFIYLLINPCNFKPPAPTDLIGPHEVQKLRKTLRLSLRQFGDMLGVSEGTIRGWEATDDLGWQPRAAARHRLLEIAQHHGLPLEFLVSDRTAKSAGIQIKNPLNYQDRRNLKELGKKRPDFRKKIAVPPPQPTTPAPPPPKTVTVGNRSAFANAGKLFGLGS